MERVVITGVSGGIGAACVGVFQGLGAEVVGVDISPSSSADDHLVLDLSDPNCGTRLLSHLEGRPVDVLVNNAAIGYAEEAVSADAGDFDRIMAVNLRGPFLLSTSLYPTLRVRSGSVVNVSSVHAVASTRLVSIYAASKGGLVALTRALAIEWAPGVRVNCVLPGAVDTGLLSDGLLRANATLAQFEQHQPLKRVGQPEEVAEAVAFLAANRFVTGASLVVDGGASARLSTE